MTPNPTPPIQATLAEFADQIQALGVTVIMMTPSITEQVSGWGYYDHTTRTIWLRPNLAYLQARSVLAHELAHAKLGHSGQCETQERAAEASAAQQLIGDTERLRATAHGLNLIGALAVALGVLSRGIAVYMTANREHATAAILDALTTPQGLTVPRPTAYRRQHQPITYDRMTADQATAEATQQTGNTMSEATQHPNPHQPWCDLNSCYIDTDLTTFHTSKPTDTVISERATLTTTLQRVNDGHGTRAYAEMTGTMDYTAEELDAMAEALTDTAAQLRATP
ncbi:ImmA/IrrE family metallo-endopeptidase [Glutamicibacter creatinolyticus]|uniref:ImmA/IrrE family metallo-endopeptidase n=1 Tax=Glutamicibacter creatinolyticus TaxID=162496 RepID=UPI0037BED922